jgi:hypothetical protein
MSPWTSIVLNFLTAVITNVNIAKVTHENELTSLVTRPRQAEAEARRM